MCRHPIAAYAAAAAAAAAVSSAYFFYRSSSLAKGPAADSDHAMPVADGQDLTRSARQSPDPGLRPISGRGNSAASGT